jgi:hypothetical protein
LHPINPYTLPAGPALDAFVHRLVLEKKTEEPCPSYSTDPAEAERVRAQIKARFGAVITTGKTRITTRPWFARYGTDPSGSTEVLAETLPLAICRLALLRVSRESNLQD